MDAASYIGFRLISSSRKYFNIAQKLTVLLLCYCCIFQSRLHCTCTSILQSSAVLITVQMGNWPRPQAGRVPRSGIFCCSIFSLNLYFLFLLYCCFYLKLQATSRLSVYSAAELELVVDIDPRYSLYRPGSTLPVRQFFY